MITIYTPYRPPAFFDVTPAGDSITVQGLVTSLSVILNGHDDNNMRVQEQGYSGDTVRDLYPELFGRPTKYEIEYEKQAAESYAREMGVSSEQNDEPPAPGASSAPASGVSEDAPIE